MSLTQIPGLGPRARQRLASAGIHDPYDLVGAGPRAIADILGAPLDRARMLVRLAAARIARGLDDPEPREDRSPPADRPDGDGKDRDQKPKESKKDRQDARTKAEKKQKKEKRRAKKRKKKERKKERKRT